MITKWLFSPQGAIYFFSMFKMYDMDYAINILNNKNPPSYTSRGKR